MLEAEVVSFVGLNSNTQGHPVPKEFNAGYLRDMRWVLFGFWFKTMSPRAAGI